MNPTAFSLNYSTTGAQINIHRSQFAQLCVRRTAAGPRAEFRRPPFPRVGNRLACASSSDALVAFGGGGGGGGGGGEGGGGGGDGGEVKGDWIVVGVDHDDSYVLDDVIVLDVEGMTCGGCSGKVKRILESQPLVSAASVNHQTKMAIIWPVPEAKVTPNWQTVLGEELAKHLTTCGFNSNFRGEAATEGEAS